MKCFCYISPATLLLLFLLSGCGRDALEVRSYDVAKADPAAPRHHQMSPAASDGMGNAPAPDAMAAGSAESVPAAITSPDVKWETPAGWTQGAGSSMRLVSFTMSGGGDGSIVVLGGGAGGLVANVNRWRGQIGLAPESEQGIQAAAKLIKGKSGEINWFKLVGGAQGGNSILAAIIATPDKSIFVKLVGSRAVLEANQGKFLKLCKSIQVQQ